ncbi:MAG: hypothetical protein KF802_05340 [Bdellovibrionaceae bacterium]|nr:hypothetical protein [Pseudobdellovibrionaceae bacterium]
MQRLAFFGMFLFVPLFAQAFPIQRNLGVTLEALQSELNPERLSPRQCAGVLDRVSAAFLEMEASDLDPGLARSQGRAWVGQLFRLRLSLNSHLKSLTRQGLAGDAEGFECARAVRRISRAFRSLEDQLILWSLQPKEFDSKTDPAAGPVLQGSSPQLLRRDATAPVRLRSGDVLLSRGNSFISAAIARISREEAQFSHMAQVYIDAPVGTTVSIEDALMDPRVKTVEAHIEVGVFTRPFRDYVRDGNSRVLLFRPLMTAARAHLAGRSVHDGVLAYQQKKMREAGRSRPTVNDNPPYDFRMDLHDSSEIFCSEVVALAFRSVGLQLPFFQSPLRSNPFTRRMGLAADRTFAPADIEIDPNFELVAEWRDVRKLATVARKEAALSAMYRWMDQRAYRFHTMAPDWLAAWIGWSARQAGLGFQSLMPKNMKRDTIAIVFSLERVGLALEKRLISVEKAERRAGRQGPSPFFAEQQDQLEMYRAEDEREFRAHRRDEFHTDFNWNLW